MNRRLKQAAVGAVIVIAAAQLIRPDRATPATDARRTIQAQVGTASGLVAVLDRACNDCHSNRAAWPWFTKIAPVSWAWSHGLKEARDVVNFSDWAAYRPDQQRKLLMDSCQAASSGTMPGAWTLVRPDAKLSTRDIETICVAARQADAVAARRF